jgi:hypothetical protein
VSELLGILVFGLASAAIYAVAASGLVVTYTTSGIFNFAHGAVAMVCAFVYWQLSSPAAWGLPVPLALVLTIGVFAPGFGFLIDRVLMRRLHDAPPITRIVVPIGLLVALIQWRHGHLVARRGPEPAAVLRGPGGHHRGRRRPVPPDRGARGGGAVAAGLRIAALRHPPRRRHAGGGREPRARRAERCVARRGSRRWPGRSAARWRASPAC